MTARYSFIHIICRRRFFFIFFFFLFLPPLLAGCFCLLHIIWCVCVTLVFLVFRRFNRETENLRECKKYGGRDSICVVLSHHSTAVEGAQNSYVRVATDIQPTQSRSNCRNGPAHERREEEKNKRSSIFSYLIRSNCSELQRIHSQPYTTRLILVPTPEFSSSLSLAQSKQIKRKSFFLFRNCSLSFNIQSRQWQQFALLSPLRFANT